MSRTFERSPLSNEDRMARGKAACDRIGWASIRALTTTNRDPLAILEQQNEQRLASLIPLRAERMSASSFTFYRGTAGIMAADLERDPQSGILVASCGDAHVSNFGFYASPQRTLLFDLNDFDEAAWAPWEWDVKRLVASIVIAGQSTSRESSVVEAAAINAVDAYRRFLNKALQKSSTTRYFAHFDVRQRAHKMDKRSRAALALAIDAAAKRTGKRAVKKLTRKDEDGLRLFVERPPGMLRVDTQTADDLANGLDQYLNSANVDIQLLLQHYALVDIAQRVVGVGSVGTRCYVALFVDGDGHSLILQVKEARESVLAQYGRIKQPDQVNDAIHTSGEGARVVGLQRILQALSDPFLGHFSQKGHDFYVRQFHDMKGGIEMDSLDDEPFERYAVACGRVLARAHAQSPNAAEIVGFAGSGPHLSEAIVSWALEYAHVSRNDFATFLTANKV